MTILYQAPSQLTLKDKAGIFNVKTDDILSIEALSDYVIIQTETGKYVTYSTMKNMEEELPEWFSRTHRSHIVNLSKITRIQGNHALVQQGNKTIPVKIGRVYRKDFLQAFKERNSIVQN